MSGSDVDRDARRERVNRTVQRIGIWCGPAAGVLVVIGICALARWIPPWVHPDHTAQEVADLFTRHADRIRIGTFIGCVGFTLLAPWGMTIAAQVRSREGRSPLLSHLLVGCTAVATVFVVLTCCVWATAVFRPAEIDPEITRALNDLSWITFLFSAPPFTLWAAVMAVAILGDDPRDPVYPRWLGYLSAWVAILILPAGLVIFFDHGAFGYAGVFALYVPFVVFFTWLVALTRCTLQNLAAAG
ncbi:MAG: hypothetical protein M0P31_09675 [Solirubrobacteraceae bacterium]|nr:hypothetical protein [Solirubrobacteraceae bacterium]